MLRGVNFNAPGALSAASLEAVVVIDNETAVFEGNVVEGGVKMQLTYAGRLEQASETEPLKP